MLSVDTIRFIMPQASTSKVETYLPWLNEWMPKYGITTKERIRHFLAQVAHESGQLNYHKELASGAAYDTGRLAERLGNTPEKDGDGQKYKGRGLIQVTGAINYGALSRDWGVNALENPEILETPDNAVRSACWFWWRAGLNKLVDKGADVKSITKKVNGGYNGLQERIDFYNRARKVI